MSRIPLGVLCGLIFGSVDVALMIPMSFPDKRAALMGAFIGILMSLPDAIITKAMAPILASGAVGGVIIGWVAGRYGK
jgi:hypothetical protein